VINQTQKSRELGGKAKDTFSNLFSSPPSIKTLTPRKWLSIKKQNKTKTKQRTFHLFVVVLAFH